MSIWKRLAVTSAGVLASGVVAFGAAYFGFAGQYVVPATTTDDPTLPGRSVDGYRYHLEVFGLPTRPMVLVVHGGPGADYRALLSLQGLSDEYQVAFYDQRGTGLSPRVPDEQLSFEQYLEDLHAIASSLSAREPVRLIGHSFGAMLAAAYIERHPDRVSHVVLAEPAFLTAQRGDEWFAAIGRGRPEWSLAVVGGAFRALMQSLHVYGPDQDARRDFLAISLMQLAVPEHPLRRYFCHADIKRAHLPMWRAGRRALDAVLAKSLNEDGRFKAGVVTSNVKQYPHKVLLMSGSCNQIMGPAVQRENLALFTHAELVVIDGAGHTFFGERPEASLAALRSYLAEDHSAITVSQ